MTQNCTHMVVKLYTNYGNDYFDEGVMEAMLMMVMLVIMMIMVLPMLIRGRCC